MANLTNYWVSFAAIDDNLPWNDEICSTKEYDENCSNPVFLVFLFQTQAQKLSGQWTGGFVSSGDFYGGKTEYVLEIEIKGEDVSGYSYTYFNIVGKRCYVICRLTGSYDRESKSLVVSEVEKVKSNTPPDLKTVFRPICSLILNQVIQNCCRVNGSLQPSKTTVAQVTLNWKEKHSLKSFLKKQILL
jgi:hypothetical protein